MIFQNPEHYKLNARYYLAEYHPYKISGEINPDFHASGSGRILDFKEKNAIAQQYFFDRLNRVLPLGTNFTVCRVPSSDPDNTDSGITVFAKKVAAAGGRIDGTACLVRTKKIPKLAHGGCRDKQVHLDSIIVADAHLISGKEVLLLDDVMTSGNSLEACKEILYKAGAEKVQALAIAKTV